MQKPLANASGLVTTSEKNQALSRRWGEPEQPEKAENILEQSPQIRQNASRRFRLRIDLFHVCRPLLLFALPDARRVDFARYSPKIQACRRIDVFNAFGENQEPRILSIVGFMLG